MTDGISQKRTKPEPSGENDRSAPCAMCGDVAVVDGVRAGVRAGRLLCSHCADRRIRYVAECLDCEWDYECEDSAFNWYHARMRVQQEGNTHEGHKKLDGESHDTVWRYLGPDDSQKGGFGEENQRRAQR